MSLGCLSFQFYSGYFTKFNWIIDLGGGGGHQYYNIHSYIYI